MEIPADKGAKFRKCDFQVHTPRDAQWTGPFHPVSDRVAFATALVTDCRRRGLGAIAITDHHDLCLWRFVRDAASTEIAPNGHEYPASQRLVVFPGVEITLSTPACQALLLFDPDLSAEQLAHIWGALRVTPTPDTSPKTTTTQALHIELSLPAITEALDGIRINPEETNPANFRFLKGRFLLLPNISDGGYKTMLRAGFHTHFKDMPCVGGYIEGAFYSDFAAGDRAKVEGKAREWGTQPLGVFQTSDCRVAVARPSGEPGADFTGLGAWPTWVKWAEPSTEALRQACLARRSRISHSEPVYPPRQVAAVVVSDSSFLGPVELGLNPQFNAFIGGRGTGKSSLLEYIRWALCDEPQAGQEGAELPNFQKRRQALVENTLKPLDGKVTVFYRRNGVLYRIERLTSDRSGSVSVFAEDENEVRMTHEQIRSEFPIVSYAQKQLSCVGTLPDEVNRLITDPVKDKLAEIQNRIDSEIIPQLKERRTRERRLVSIESQISQHTTSIKGKKEQVQALQGQLQSLTPEQQEVVKVHQTVTDEQQLLSRATELPDEISGVLDQAKSQIEAFRIVEPPTALPNAEKLKAISADAIAFKERVARELEGLIGMTQDSKWAAPSNQAAIAELSDWFTKHNAAYEKCIADTAKNAKQLEEINGLNKQIADLDKRLATLESERSTLRALIDKAGSKWDAFIAALSERAALLTAECDRVNDQAQHEFKAEVRACSDKAPLKTALSSLLQGRNIKSSEEKIDALCDAICKSDSPPARWAAAIAEIEALSASKDATTLPDTPILRTEFTEENLKSIKTGVSLDAIETVRYVNIGDQIVFWYRLGDAADGRPNYIPFDSASQGQQATCLLRTLLAQEGAPLLIDQPEEDLDNEQIHVLSERISETKHNRQLLFVSHNANIVVNGDAELVVCFGHREAGTRTRGKISPVGSIDCESVRNVITSVMEGGRDAFELRKRKYGF